MLVNAPENGVIFTASGTEANNLALRGVCAAARGKPIHVITSAIEHPAVRQVIRVLGRDGVATSVLRVSADGIVDPDELRAALRPETRLVSIMAANNVIGTLQPVRELAAVAHECGALFHTDAVQTAGHVPLALERDRIDLLSSRAPAARSKVLALFWCARGFRSSHWFLAAAKNMVCVRVPRMCRG